MIQSADKILFYNTQLTFKYRFLNIILNIEYIVYDLIFLEIYYILYLCSHKLFNTIIHLVCYIKYNISFIGIFTKINI